jgi:hypothetical protein
MNSIFLTICIAWVTLLAGFTLAAGFIFCWLLRLARKEERERDAEAEEVRNTTTYDTFSYTTYGKRAG